MAQQNVEVRIVGKDNASPVIAQVGNTLERMKISVESNRGALGKLDGALRQSATQMLGLSGTAGRLSQALLAFGPTGIVGGLAVAGISLFVNAMRENKEETNQANDILLNFIKTAGKVEVAERELAGDELGAKLTKVRVGYQEINEQLDQFIRNQKIAGGITITAASDDPIKDQQKLYTQGIKQLEEFVQNLILQRTSIEVEIRKLENIPTPTFLERIFTQADPVSADIPIQLDILRKKSKELNESILTEGEKLQSFRLLDLELQKELQKVTDDNAKRTKSGIEDIVKEYTQLRSLQEANVQLTERQNTRLFQLGTQANEAIRNSNLSLEDRAKWLTITNDLTKRAAEDNKRFAEYTSLVNDATERAISGVERYNAKLRENQEVIRNLVSTDISGWVDKTNADLDKLKEVSITDILTGAPMGDERDMQRRRNKELEDQKKQEEKLRAITGIAYSVADGFDVMTDAIMNGNNAFKSLEMGARSAFRGIMRVFAQEQIAKGIGAIGSALGQTALGNFPAAGLFYKSAAKHFAAAAAAGVVGGVVGGGGSNRGGGGGFSDSNLGNAGRGQAPIFITITGGGILDMNNPETARAFSNAINVATNRRTIITRR